MCLCDRAQATVLGEDGDLRSRWEGLLLKEKQFLWPENGFNGGVQTVGKSRLTVYLAARWISIWKSLPTFQPKKR